MGWFTTYQLVQEFFHSQYLWNYTLVDFIRLEIQILMPLIGSMVGCVMVVSTQSSPIMHHHHFQNTMYGFLKHEF